MENPMSVPDGWQENPTETGWYWMATKKHPACKVTWYFAHDDALTIMGGPGEGTLWIGAVKKGAIRKAFPEAVFKPFPRPENPYKDVAKRELTSKSGDVWLGRHGEM